MKDSGIEWIGKIPNKTYIKRFKYTYDESMSGEVIDKGFWNDGDELLYTCQKTPMKSTYSSFPIWKRTRKNDLLLTRNATPYIFNPGINSIYSNVVQKVKIKDEYNKLFLKYAIQLGADEQRVNGDTIPSYNMDVWGNIYFVNFNIDVQDKIASFLNTKCSNIDLLIKDIELQINTLEEYKKAVITETVTKGLKSDIEMKNSNNVLIGKYPKEWILTRLKYVLSGPMKYGASETGVDYRDDLPRYIRITDITSDNKLKEEDKLSLTEQQAKGYLLKDNTILFARSGATVGKTFFYKKEYGLSAFAGYLISACPNTKIVIPKIVYYWTLSNVYLSWANSIFSQATIQNIGADKYCNMPILIPTKNEQEEIVEFLDAKCSEIDSIISDKIRQLDLLDKYKKSLIYEYVTGKREAV